MTEEMFKQIFVEVGRAWIRRRDISVIKPSFERPQTATTVELTNGSKYVVDMRVEEFIRKL